MNWKEIRENYPKAWEDLNNTTDECLTHEKLDICVFDNLVRVDENGSFKESYPIRDLYDFFDEREIRGSYDIMGSIFIVHNEVIITYSIMDEWLGVDGFDMNTIFMNQNRTQAETILFEKCFSILEEQLKK